MKKLKSIFVLLAVMMQVSAVSDSLYQEANVLYQQGAYEAALSVYQEIIASGSESPDLFYNMGNAAFRSNNIGKAILYYEKSLKLDPSHEDALHNLEYVSQYRVDAFDQVPELFVKSWIQRLIQSLPERTWSILAICLFLVFLSSLIFYVFSKSLALKKAGFYSALLGLVLFGITLASAISQYRSIVRPESAVILSPSVVVRSSPSNSGTELFILHEGTKVQVLEEVSGWHNIRVVDGREGWILSNDFESI